MPGISISKMCIPFGGGGVVDWVAYWAGLISATVENAAPTHVVLTFPTAQTSLGASDFTIAGFTISSASWTGVVLTLVLSEAVMNGQSLTVTFLKTGGTAVVINNVIGLIEFQTVQPGTINQVSLTYRITTGKTVNLNWGTGADIALTADNVDHVITSAYVTNNTTYDISMVGDTGYIVKFYLYNEPTILLNSSEIKKMVGLTSLTLKPYGGTVVVNSSDLRDLPLTYLNINNNISGTSVFTTADCATMPLTYFEVNIASANYTVRTVDFVGKALATFSLTNISGTSNIDTRHFAGMPLAQIIMLAYGNQYIKSADLIGLPLTYWSIRGGVTGADVVINSADFSGMALTVFDQGHTPANTVIDSSDLVGMPLTNFTLYGNGGTYNIDTADFSAMSSLQTFYVDGSVGNVNVQGQLSDLPTGILALTIRNTTSTLSISSGAMKAWTNTTMILQNHHVSSEVDAFLIAWATPAGTATKTITLSNARTAASDAAVTTLNGKNKTIITSN